MTDHETPKMACNLSIFSNGNKKWLEDKQLEIKALKSQVGHNPNLNN